MTDGIAAHLLGLHSQAKISILAAQDSHASELGRLLQLDLDIKQWEDALISRPEAHLITAARRELGFALYAACAGIYLHSYAGLRLFLELSFASVYFSANEFHRRRWIADRADFSWSAALDPDNGVLSKSFVREFNSTAADDSMNYANIAASTYRHCSQFIHGKLAVTRTLPDQLSYSPSVLADWIGSATKAATAVLFLLYSRYGDELIASNGAGALIVTLESSFLHIASVRAKIGLPIEVEPEDA